MPLMPADAVPFRPNGNTSDGLRLELGITGAVYLANLLYHVEIWDRTPAWHANSSLDVVSTFLF